MKRPHSLRVTYTPTMPTFYSAFALLLINLPLTTANVNDWCPGTPTGGCQNGVFDDKSCKCICIPPFCPDTNGECNGVMGSCGGNPWSDCTPGEDCPWWVNRVKAETCMTGTTVPAGIWFIWASRTDCCRIKFPYSDVCDPVSTEVKPTPYPSLPPPELEEFEIVPIKFDLQNMSDDIDVPEFKDEMKDILLYVLTNLKSKIKGLQILDITERKLRKQRRSVRLLRRIDDFVHLRRTADPDDDLFEEEEFEMGYYDQHERGLNKDITVIYDVKILRREDRLGPIIIQKVKNSYDVIIEEIRAYSDANNFDSDFDFAFCTTRDGGFNLCAGGTPSAYDPNNPYSYNPNPNDPYSYNPNPNDPTYSDPRVDPRSYNMNDEENETLAIWAILLIVLVLVVCVCCVGFLLIMYTRKEDDDKKEAEKNMYMDTRPKKASHHSHHTKQTSDRSRRSSHDDRRSSHASRHRRRDDESDDWRDNYTEDSRTARKSRRSKRRPEPVIPAYEQHRGQLVVVEEGVEPAAMVPYDPSSHRGGGGRDPSSYPAMVPYDPSSYRGGGGRNRSKHRGGGGRDPSVYEGDSTRPDPEAGVLVLTDGSDASSRQWRVEPPNKPQDDPSVYTSAPLPLDSSSSSRGSSRRQWKGDPPNRPQDDPSQTKDEFYYETSTIGTSKQGAEPHDFGEQPEGALKHMRSMYADDVWDSRTKGESLDYSI